MSAFDSLRHSDNAAAPDPRFVRHLKSAIANALAPAVELTERKPIMSATDTQPNPSRGLVPYLTVDNAAAAIDWYRQVFDATELVRYTGDDGRIGHCQLVVSGSVMMVADHYPEAGTATPPLLGGTPVRLNLNVDDVDTVYARAIESGATNATPPDDHAYGERGCRFTDPYGHEWMAQTTIGHPSNAEIEAAMGGAFKIAGAESQAAPESRPTPVEVGYITFAFDDTLKARAFYGALFGWESERGNLGDTYAHINNTRLPMGMTPDGVGAAPSIHFRVTDADASASQVVELGGTIESRAEYDSGLNIACIDDQGHRFMLWQPAEGY